jgi:hypothetical protein
MIDIINEEIIPNKVLEKTDPKNNQVNYGNSLCDLLKSVLFENADIDRSKFENEIFCKNGFDGTNQLFLFKGVFSKLIIKFMIKAAPETFKKILIKIKL